MTLQAVALQACVSGAVSTTVAFVVGLVVRYCWRRFVKPQLVELQRAVGLLTPVGHTVPVVPVERNRMDPRTIRKAVAAGAGFVVTGLLEWAVSATDLEPWLEQLVPAPLVPLAPILLGGIATVGAVYRASNLSAAAPTISAPVAEPPEEPAAAAPSPQDALSAPTAAAGVSVSTPLPAGLPFWSGVPAGEPQSSTSLVVLPPAPSRPSPL